MAFSQGATGLSPMPSRFESILGVTVESVQGNQVYLEWIGTLGSFLIVARPLEFLSSFTLRMPSLELGQECRDTFPEEAETWTLTRIQPRLNPGHPKRGRRGDRDI